MKWKYREFWQTHTDVSPKRPEVSISLHNTAPDNWGKSIETHSCNNQYLLLLESKKMLLEPVSVSLYV